MDNKMFCFQCEQTAGCSACTGKAGVCGKSADAANLQDELTGALIGLAKATDNSPKVNGDTWRLMIEGLFATVTNVNFNEKTLREIIGRVKKEKARLMPGCSECAAVCGRVDDYDLKELWQAQEDIRSLRFSLLFGVRGMAAYAYHAMVLGYTDEEINRFFAKALFYVGEDFSAPTSCFPSSWRWERKILNVWLFLTRRTPKATEHPPPSRFRSRWKKVRLSSFRVTIFTDLKLLLEQTAGKGINIYTHSEMLPAHGYPELKKYPHLKGNFGTAWQNQQREFADIPAPVLFTTNCLMPPKASYADRIFTTSVVSYPEMVHIGREKDFSPVIEKALELGGYDEDKKFTGINGGGTVTTGFARGAVLGAADKIVEAVKNGTIKHFFLVGGCDGAVPAEIITPNLSKTLPPTRWC